MGQISLQAHAKINLTLDVVGRRDDGYHLLKSVMQSLSLADIITIDLLPPQGDHFHFRRYPRSAYR